MVVLSKFFLPGIYNNNKMSINAYDPSALFKEACIKFLYITGEQKRHGDQYLAMTFILMVKRCISDFLFKGNLLPCNCLTILQLINVSF